MTGADLGCWPGKYAAKALLGYIIDTRLTAAGPGPVVSVPSPWDTWWACYRAAIPLPALASRILIRDRSCPSCVRRALQFADANPPGHPGTGAQACGCLLRWAGQMRAPGPRVTWPPLVLFAVAHATFLCVQLSPRQGRGGEEDDGLPGREGE